MSGCFLLWGGGRGQREWWREGLFGYSPTVFSQYKMITKITGIIANPILEISSMLLTQTISFHLSHQKTCQRLGYKVRAWVSTLKLCSKVFLSPVLGDCFQSSILWITTEYRHLQIASSPSFMILLLNSPENLQLEQLSFPSFSLHDNPVYIQ